MMRRRFCVVVRHDGKMSAIGSFYDEQRAKTYASTLPAGCVLGVAEIETTDMFRVKTGHGAIVQGGRSV